MSRFRRDTLGTIDEINVTPLVDLTFLLLIVFMITAPVLEYSVTVNPPELNATPIEDVQHRVVTLDAKGVLHFERDVVTKEELAKRLEAALAANPAIQVFIRADEDRPYGDVMRVLKTVKHAGVENFSLVTTSESP